MAAINYDNGCIGGLDVYTPKADDVKKLFELAKDYNLEFDLKELYLYLISTVYATECGCECEIEE